MALMKSAAQTAGLLAASIALSTFAISANAQDTTSGFYFGAFGGQASYDVAGGDVDEALEFELGAVLGNSDLDDRDTGFGVIAGYRFNQYFALEAGYIDLGNASYSAEGSFDVFEFAAGADIGASGPTAAAVGLLPVADSFDLYGKAGLFFSDLEYDLSATVTLDGETIEEGGSISASSEDTFVGVGAAWRIGQNWSINFEFTRFLDVGDEEETGEGDIDLLAAGFTVRL